MNLHPLAAIALIGAAALAGCGKMGELERPGPMFGKGSGADAGADPAMVDQWGVSPLAHAQEKGFAEIAEMLSAALA